MAYYTRSRTRGPIATDCSPCLYGGDLPGSVILDVHDRRGAENECSHIFQRTLTNVGVFRFTAWPWYGGGTRTVYDNAWTCIRSGYCSHSSWPLPPDPGDILGDLNRSVGDYIREAGRTSFHAISFIREVESTISMLKNPFKLIKFVQKHASKKAKRTTFKNALRSAHSNSLKGTANAAADTWLEGTYGWNPFVGDLTAVAGIANGAIASRRLAAQAPPQKFSFPIRRKAMAESVASSWGTYQPFRFRKTSLEVLIKGKYYGTFSVNPSIQAESYMASLARGLNLDRIGYAVWDAVPYSFVVDWFSNIGTIIDNTLSGPAFYSYVDTPYLSYKTRTIATVEVETTPGWYGPYDGLPSGAGTYSEEHTSFERHPGPIDQIVLTAKNGMRGQRIASGIALAWGLIRR